MSAAPEVEPHVDRAMDNIILEVLRAHRVKDKDSRCIACECGVLISRRGNKSMAFRHSRHQAWHIAWELRDEGYMHRADL